MGKQNPRRIPCTQADVDRAYKRGQEEGAEFMLTMVLFVLKDKHDAKDEEIDQFHDEFMDLVDSVNRGYVTFADIRRALSDEFDLTVNLV